MRTTSLADDSIAVRGDRESDVAFEPLQTGENFAGNDVDQSTPDVASTSSDKIYPVLTGEQLGSSTAAAPGMRFSTDMSASGRTGMMRLRRWALTRSRISRVRNIKR
jgi:hypothetical protein